MEDKSQHYEIIFSKSKKKIIYGDKTYFGSIFNPEKEAKNIVQDYEEKIKFNKNILVLGLASGYHIIELEKLMNKYHHDYMIYVLEPSEEIIELNNEIHLFNQEKVKIVNINSVATIYENLDFIMFLNEHPVIIKQPVSFLKFANIFREFLTYKAPKAIKDYLHLLPENLRSNFTAHNQETLEDNIHDFISKNMAKRKTLSPEDIFLLSFNEIINDPTLAKPSIQE